jgi:TRAP-type mannitol/chloroaromatic compound transport system substrate-binding protein
VQYFAAGERVGAFDSFDEVASGNAQAYIAPTTTGRASTRLGLFTSVPFGLTYVEHRRLDQVRGGQALWDELAWRIRPEVLVRQHRRADGWLVQQGNQLADDLKGLKMRIPGLGGDVMAKLGASPVSLPGGQIYENLVSGAIDATEWVGPWNDYFMKFYEAAKYYYYPGMHEPGGSWRWA